MGDGVSAGARRRDQARPERGVAERKLRMGFVLDVVGYGARSAPLRSDVQRRLPRLVSTMLLQSGMALESVEHEWTGDGINVVIPADADPTVALPLLLRTLAALLGQDNARGDDRMRLRMSVGIGLVENSTAGFGGPMIIEMSRMVNSAALRSSLEAYPRADLVAAISDQVYSAIIRPGYPGIPGTQFTRVDVAEKEYRAPAWIWVSARQWTEPAYAPLSRSDPRIVGRPEHGSLPPCRPARRRPREHGVPRAGPRRHAGGGQGLQARRVRRDNGKRAAGWRRGSGQPPRSGGRAPRCSWTPIPTRPPPGSRRS